MPIHRINSYLFNPADRPSATIERRRSRINICPVSIPISVWGLFEYRPQCAQTATRYYIGVLYGKCIGRGRNQRVRPYDAEYRQRNNDIKSSTIQGQMVQGNLKLANHHINQHNRSGEIKNTRSLTQTAAPRQLAGTEFMGQQHSKQQYNSTIQLDRNTPDMLDAFRNNPYTHSITGSVSDKSLTNHISANHIK